MPKLAISFHNYLCAASTRLCLNNVSKVGACMVLALNLIMGMGLWGSGCGGKLEQPGCVEFKALNSVGGPLPLLQRCMQATRVPRGPGRRANEMSCSVNS